MGRKRKLASASAAIALIASLSACALAQQENQSENAEKSAQTRKQSTTETDSDLSAELGIGNLENLRNLASPQNESGKVSFADYKSGITEVLFSNSDELSESDTEILDAYSQCLAAKTYPQVSAEYAQIIASRNLDQLATEELNESDASIFDESLRECFELEQAD